MNIFKFIGLALLCYFMFKTLIFCYKRKCRCVNQRNNLMLTSPRIENDNDNNKETVELNELSNQNNDPP